ncbi:MAG: hypothetical protein V2J62_07035 [candidate division KSB1 bacterium]|nr:hypothetical protein [candidate division KSB1 bacterium]
MKRFYILSIIFLSLLVILGCEKDMTIVQPQMNNEGGISASSVNPELIAKELSDLNGWQREGVTEDHHSKESLTKTTGHLFLNFEKEHITGQIFHYKFQVRTGPGPYDIIGIHRVVKERWYSFPIYTKKTFFFQHGDAKDFEGMVLPGLGNANTPDGFGLAVFLAERNIDVWGIDQAWTLVPEGTADLSFMKDWGLQRQVDDLNIGIEIARYARLFSGSGFNKMILCGYSSGVVTGYALLNAETQLPPAERQVKGYIPVDLGIKIVDPYLQQFFADFYFTVKDAINSGIYHEDVPFRPIGMLARNDPDGASPIFDGFTNLQTALFFGAGQVFGPDAWFHYLAGTLEEGMPVDLNLVTLDQWLDFLESAPVYEPYLFEAEYAAVFSDAADLPFDDYLSQIDVPILNVAAAGGIGELSKYGTGLLGSTDVEHLIVSIGAPSLAEEFGHIDLFIARNAPELVWNPIKRWIKKHSKLFNNEDFDSVVFDVE